MFKKILLIIVFGAALFYLWSENVLIGLMRVENIAISEKLKYRHCDTVEDRNGDRLVDKVTYSAPHQDKNFKPDLLAPNCINKGLDRATDTNVYTWEDLDLDGKFDKMSCKNAWNFPC